MDDMVVPACFLILIVACVTCAIAIPTTAGVEANRWQKEAIQHGAAYYHPDTGKFTWKDGLHGH